MKKYLSLVPIIALIIATTLFVKYVRFPEKSQLEIPRQSDFIDNITSVPNESICSQNIKKYTNVIEARKESDIACFLKITDKDNLKKLTTEGKYLQKVEKLVLMDIEDVVIPSQISEMCAVKELTLDALEGDSFVPKEIGDFKNLITLKVAETELESLPPEIGELANLKTIYISRNENLQSLPFSVAKLNRLENITIRYNPSLRIPPAIFSHKSIKSVIILGQNLKDVPNEIWNLKNITKLELADNHLTKISEKINKMNSLEVLHLSQNNLGSIPPLNNLDRLTEIYLDNNNLKRLPNGLEQLNNLKRLSVKNNYLRDYAVQKTIFPENLTALDLGGNILTKIPLSIFTLKNLEYLRLSGNYIEKKEIEYLRKKLPGVLIAY